MKQSNERYFGVINMTLHMAVKKKQKKKQKESVNDLCSIKTKTQALLRWLVYSKLYKRKLEWKMFMLK